MSLRVPVFVTQKIWAFTNQGGRDELLNNGVGKIGLLSGKKNPQVRFSPQTTQQNKFQPMLKRETQKVKSSKTEGASVDRD